MKKCSALVAGIKRDGYDGLIDTTGWIDKDSIIERFGNNQGTGDI